MLIVIAARLLTSSLGFNSELTRKWVLVPNTFNVDAVVHTRRNYITSSQYYLNYMSPLDNLLVADFESNEEPFSQFNHVLEKFAMKRYQLFSNYTKDLADNVFHGDESAKLLTKRFATLMRAPLHLKFVDNSILNMANTNTQSNNAHNLGKVHRSLYETKEFLMTEGDLEEWPNLQNLMNRHQMGGIFGPQTFKTMEEIGWPTRRAPTLSHLKKFNPAANFMDSLKDHATKDLKMIPIRW